MSVSERAEPGTPLYVHLPFCAAKCHYCDFFSVPDEGQDVDGAVRAVLAEAAERAPESPRTVFLGGGTPSLLSIEQLRVLLDGLDDLCGFRASAEEVTAECNPESLDQAKATAFLELGVRRLSIGFQALDDRLLELFGRVHSVADSFRAFADARAAGVEALSVDLIFAAPGQRPEGWARDLERVLDLGPDHLSAYNLTFEEETRFKRWLDEGRFERADEDLELSLFHTARETLARRGYTAYEISNFALSDRECHHNLNYWHNGPYVGIGPSAASKLGHRRFGNPRSIGAWRRAVERARPATAWSEELGPAQRLGETWWLGLRLTEGLSPVEARERAGLKRAPDPGPPGPDGGGWEDVEAPEITAARLAEQGLLERAGERYRLTARGLPLADAVAREFLVAPASGPSLHGSAQPVG